MKRGKFIVIDGPDGSGKTTQITMLKEALEAQGKAVELLDFPRYDEPSSYFVRQYLKGHYGPLKEQSPYRTSYFYALDRFDASFEIQQKLNEGAFFISDRYTSSNVGHQGAAFASEEREDFFTWLDQMEFEQMGVVKPDLVCFLRVPHEVSLRLIQERIEKGERKTLDILEEDHEHLKQALASYELASELFDYWRTVECSEDGELLSRESIHERILATISELL